MTKKTFKGEKVISVELDDCKMPEKEITFGQYVKAKRIEKSFSIRRFCEGLNMSADDMAYWSQVEKGNLPFDSSIVPIAKIIRLLGLRNPNKSKMIELANIAIKIEPKEDPIFYGSINTPYQKYLEGQAKKLHRNLFRDSIKKFNENNKGVAL